MTEPERRIAILLPNLAGGGVERVRLYLAHEFLARGYRVDLVLLRAEGALLELVPDRVRLIDLQGRRMRDLLGPLTTYLRREKPDAILAAMWPLTSFAAVARRLARCKARLVVSDHGVLSEHYAENGLMHRAALRATMALTYRDADARVAVSAGLADDLAALSGIPRRRFEVVNNPVPAPSDDRLPDADAVWGAPPGRRILSVGSLKAEKNQALLIRAFARLRGSEDARLMLLGEGALRDELVRLAASEGVGGQVLMPGFVADPGPYFRSADLFVLSSDHEGFGNVILEALACGVPVVSTDCRSGPAEILAGGQFGRLVPVGDAAAMAAAMREALDQDHDRAALRRRAAEFSVTRAADRYLELMFPNERRVHGTGGEA
jgi:glycosyltransferase involved in cell wall biosynthesis